MLIKEYRIPLPMSVEEYRIAQLYMIQKKSREESHGTDSGVEIIQNKPYVNGPGGSGQYTYKIYHIGSHLPGWFRSILPKSALRVEEEAWNAYPYTKTVYRCPFVEKFLLEIETRYLSDCCEAENVFEVKKSELQQRQVDIIDIVRDPIPSGDYKKEEDPKLFRSVKTGRGPLDESWRDSYTGSNRKGKAVMCAYKLCRVEFKYWGMQNKIERFIHDVALRRTMLRAHRQAWCWQDEYHGLSIDDIRRLERETQLHLAEKMAAAKDQEGEATPSATTPTDLVTSFPAKRPSKGEASVHFVDQTPGPHEGSADSQEKDSVYNRSTSIDSSRSSTSTVVNGGRNTRQNFNRPRTSGASKEVNEWRLESLEQLQESSSDEEYFDAQDVEGECEKMEEPSSLERTSSMEMVTSGDEFCDAMSPVSSTGSAEDSSFDRRVEIFRQMYSVDHSLPPTGSDSLPSSADVCPTKVLFLVLHGGNILESTQGSVSKRSDFGMLMSTFDTVVQSHYHLAANHLAFRLVPCPHVCTNTLNILSSLSPFSYDSRAVEDGNLAGMQDFVPLGAIALFASSSAEYQDHVNTTISRANSVYHEFLNSPEGRGFTGQVCILGDSTGAMLSYDALTRAHSPFMRGGSRFGSHESIDGDFQDDVIKPASPKIPTSVSNELNPSDPEVKQKDPPGPVEMRLKNVPSKGDPTPQMVDLSRSNSGKQSSHRNSARLSASCSDRGPSRRTSSGSNYESNFPRFDFEVSDFFMFGSPLGLVLAYRRLFTGEDRNCPPVRPASLQVYNLFHSNDPLAVRVEPLLHDNFKYIPPVKICRYNKFPLGDGESIHVVETVQQNLKSFADSQRPSVSPGASQLQRQSSTSSVNSTSSGVGENTVTAITGVTERWWGNKRVDYLLYCPEVLHSFPASALAPLFHSSFWESTDTVAFILRQVFRYDATMYESTERDIMRTASFKIKEPREKWLRRRTTIKVRNLQQNHRANDVIVLEDMTQTLTARFMYGSLDIASLSGEKVDINVMLQPPSGDWVYLGTEVTDSHGKLTFTIPADKRLSQGMYPVKCVVKGDHTSVDFFLAVLPPKTETVVFSIDGSFTASVSIMGKDPKVRPGAVDVVRHWQDLGYLILYVSARPDMQHKKVVTWLAQHNFPHGMVAFMDGLSKDPLRQKFLYLKNLQTEARVDYVAAYGSSKDVNIYRELGLQAQQIFIVGKASKKQYSQAQIISDGYAAHLNGLMDPGASRPATGNARMFLRKSCFRLPTQGESKKVAKRTISYPGPATKVNEFLRLPDTGPGPTKIIVPDIPVGDDECYGSASRARGKSPIVQKNIISKNTVV
ncbi:hypothetical protein C0Q70_06893 [Pomacea canaliculata]|uniref:DDHD domain-containing protein n=1 Tax=Pomacea canaliculata TaxID=400727 RepID=A0A2T7PDK2_POMCA|nr:protein retinal degeneration B-like isoform X2 [Pomacea canaliculata]PVD31481.1 hypothetical protein C0Q70_06893 [Pomacea canaliculata]